MTVIATQEHGNYPPFKRWGKLRYLPLGFFFRRILFVKYSLKFLSGTGISFPTIARGQLLTKKQKIKILVRYKNIVNVKIRSYSCNEE